MANASSKSKGASPAAGVTLALPGAPAKKSPPKISKLYWRAIQWLLVALGVQTLTSLSPSSIETFYSQGLYLFVPRGLSHINRLVAFSVAEILLGLLVAWFLLLGGWAILRGFLGKGGVFRSMQQLVLQLVWVASVLFILFKLAWGFNYQRQPLMETLAPVPRYPLTQDLEAIGTRLVNGINENHAALQTSPASNPTLKPGEVAQILSQAVEASFQVNKLIGPAALGNYPLPKPLAASTLMSVLGVRAFYFPFTGEVSYNPAVPVAELPFAIARAKAYQRGYAREDEARFIAYLVCTSAPDPLVRYSGFLHTVEVLERLETSKVGSFRSQLAAGPQGDLKLLEDYWGATLHYYPSRMTEWLFNFHLRVNRDPRGIESLREDVPLIVAYSLPPLSSLPSDTPPAEDAPPADAISDAP